MKKIKRYALEYVEELDESEEYFDEIKVPGESDVVSNFNFHENVSIYCPICGSQSTARAREVRSSRIAGDVAVTLRVVNQSCECPEIYLQYDKQSE